MAQMPNLRMRMRSLLGCLCLQGVSHQMEARKVPRRPNLQSAPSLQRARCPPRIVSNLAVLLLLGACLRELPRHMQVARQYYALCASGFGNLYQTLPVPSLPRFFGCLFDSHGYHTTSAKQLFCTCTHCMCATAGNSCATCGNLYVCGWELR